MAYWPLGQTLLNSYPYQLNCSQHWQSLAIIWGRIFSEGTTLLCRQRTDEEIQRDYDAAGGPPAKAGKSSPPSAPPAPPDNSAAQKGSDMNDTGTLPHSFACKHARKGGHPLITLPLKHPKTGAMLSH